MKAKKKNEEVKDNEIKEEVKEENKEIEQNPDITENSGLASEDVLILKNKIENLEEKVRYHQAELINYRKRKDDEVSNMLKYANQDLIMEILPIVDNFERAIKLSEKDETSTKFIEGFKMIYTRLMSMFDKLEVKELDIEGKEFDPTVSEAVLTDHDESKPENVILEVLKKGYTYKGKLIRPAMVKVNE